MTRFYAEEPRFDGKPKRVIYEGEPPTHTSDGAKKRWIVEPIEMNAEDEDFSFDQASRMYGSNAIFRNS